MSQSRISSCRGIRRRRGFESVRVGPSRTTARAAGSGRAPAAPITGARKSSTSGGIRNKQTGEPWEQRHDGDRLLGHEGPGRDDAGHRAFPAGWLDYEEPVCAYWPEFAQQGKEQNHRPPAPGAPGRAVSRWTSRVDRGLVADLDRLAGRAGASETGVGAWNAAGLSRHHARVLREARLLRRIDPQPSQPGTVLPRTRSRRRSGWTSTSGLPEHDPEFPAGHASRGHGAIDMLLGFPLRLTLDAMNRAPKIVRALRGSELALTTSSASTRATSKCRPAAPSAQPAPSRTPTACSRTGGRELGLRQGDAGPAGRSGDSAHARVLATNA